MQLHEIGGGLAFVNSIGTMGGFAGPYMVGVLKQATGTFSAGIWAMAAVLGVAAALASALPLLARRDDRQLSEQGADA